MGADSVISAILAIAAVLVGLRYLWPKPNDGPQTPPLGSEAIDHATFDAAMRHQVRADQSRIDDGRAHTAHTSLNAAIARMPKPATPTYAHTSDDVHARRLVSGIAARHALTLFADLTAPDARDQSAILTDLLGTAGIKPYSVDISKDPALRLGLPLAPDHPVPVILYLNGLPVGDFVATTDALRDGTLAARIASAKIPHDTAALSALQNSLQKT